MTDKEIFRQVLKRAKYNGFKFNSPAVFLIEDNIKIREDWEKYRKLVHVQVDPITATYIGLESIIFSHDFAKAFWGENWIEKDEEKYDNYYFFQLCKLKTLYPTFTYSKLCEIRESIKNLKYYQYHLQQMILEKEPLKYLEKFL